MTERKVQRRQLRRIPEQQRIVSEGNCRTSNRDLGTIATYLILDFQLTCIQSQEATFRLYNKTPSTCPQILLPNQFSVYLYLVNNNHNHLICLQEPASLGPFCQQFCMLAILLFACFVYKHKNGNGNPPPKTKQK